MNTSIPSGPDLRPQPCPEQIRAQVERIVASPEFPKIGRGITFLKYVIDEALEGRSNRIKGYSVAVEVFKRAEGFTQDDPVVRIEAGRLRRSLERYYLVAGEHDPIRITIPKGGYVPRFEWICTESNEEQNAPTAPPNSEPARSSLIGLHRFAAGAGVLMLLVLGGIFSLNGHQRFLDNAPFASAPDGPTLAIAAFSDMGKGGDAKVYAEGLTEELLAALPRFKELKVFGRETSRRLSSDADPSEVGIRFGARYLLSGGVRIDRHRARVTARLSDTVTSKILWSGTYDENITSHSLLTIQTDVGNKIATAIAQPYGVISLAVAADVPLDELDAYGCTIRFYRYISEMSAQKHAEVRRCLESAVDLYPSYGTGHAMLSVVYLDEERFGFNLRTDGTNGRKPLQDALRSARKAVQVDPENSRALQALMMALFFNQQVSDGVRSGEQALLANPNDTLAMSEFGALLAMSGQWERGADLLKKALARNPAAAGYYHGVLGLCAYMQGDYQSAVLKIEQADLQKQPLFHIVAAVIYAEVGRMDDARREGEAFVKMRPGFIPNIRAELTLRNIQPSDQVRMIEGMRKIGPVVHLAP